MTGAPAPGGYVRWLRGRLGPALLPVVYATAILTDARGRILFQRRSDFGHAWWGLPGGVLEPGESPAGCAAREVEEETGLRPEALRLTGVYSSPRYVVDYPNGDRVHQVTLCFAGAIGAGQARPQADEVTALEFFEPGRLPPMPAWYADMVAHVLADRLEPYFDPPEFEPLDTPFASPMAVRRVVGSAPLVWPEAAAAVLDEAGRLLVQRRADTGGWGLPGGALAVGESLAHTVIRETREATGLEVQPVALLACYGGQGVVSAHGERLYPIGSLFACRILGGRPRAGSRESAEVRFFARDELPPLPAHLAPIVERAFEKVGR